MLVAPDVNMLLEGQQTHRFGCAPNEQGGLLPLAKSLAVAWGKDNIQARPPSRAVLSASG